MSCELKGRKRNRGLFCFFKYIYKKALWKETNNSEYCSFCRHQVLMVFSCLCCRHLIDHVCLMFADTLLCLFCLLCLEWLASLMSKDQMAPSLHDVLWSHNVIVSKLAVFVCSSYFYMEQQKVCCICTKIKTFQRCDYTASLKMDTMCQSWH